MNIVRRGALVALVLTLACGAAAAHGGRGGGHFRGGGHHWHSHVSVGVGVGFGAYGPWGWPGYGYYPYVVPAPVVVPGAVAPVVSDPPTRPPTLFSARQGQSEAQKEADVRDCNRLATMQPEALASAEAFQRAVLGCMDGRGYSAR